MTFHPQVNFHSTIGDMNSSPDAKGFLMAVHLLAGTWVDQKWDRYSSALAVNEPIQKPSIQTVENVVPRCAISS